VVTRRSMSSSGADVMNDPADVSPSCEMMQIIAGVHVGTTRFMTSTGHARAAIIRCAAKSDQIGETGDRDRR